MAYGEADDIAPMLFDQIASGDIDKNVFRTGFVSYDENFKSGKFLYS